MAHKLLQGSDLPQWRPACLGRGIVSDVWLRHAVSSTGVVGRRRGADGRDRPPALRPASMCPSAPTPIGRSLRAEHLTMASFRRIRSAGLQRGVRAQVSLSPRGLGCPDRGPVLEATADAGRWIQAPRSTRRTMQGHPATRETRPGQRPEQRRRRAWRRGRRRHGAGQGRR
jgi:hypothetical protein